METEISDGGDIEMVQTLAKSEVAEISVTPALSASHESIWDVIILDGTWKQAKQMGKQIPASIPHVKLEHLKPTISILRKQSSLDRVTTAEAVAFLLEVKTEPTFSFNLFDFRKWLFQSRFLSHFGIGFNIELMYF